MSFGSRNSGISRIDNYAQALKWFEDTKPIRGRTPELRPLGWRRNTWYRIQKNTDNAIECCMYGDPIVTFHADGDIEIKDFRYTTVSTGYFLQELLGINAYIQDKSLIIHTTPRWSTQSPAYRVPREGNGSVIFRKVDGNYHYVAGGEVRATHAVNRKKAKQIRASYADAMTYLRGMVKLREGAVYSRTAEIYKIINEKSENDRWTWSISLANYERGAGFHNAVQWFRTWLTDTNPDTRQDSLNNLLELMALSFGSYNWHEQAHELNAHQLERGMDMVIMGIHRDEMFETRELGIGEVKRDAYGKYWTKGWNKYHETNNC